MALNKVEAEPGAPIRVRTPKDLERLADRLEKWLNRSRSAPQAIDREEIATFGFIIMGLRHFDQLLAIVEENPENSAARLALETINDYQAVTTGRIMEELQS